MFDTLTEKLSSLFKNLTGQGKLSEANVREAAAQVRLALLEADVNLKVAEDFVVRVQEQALGAEVLSSISPGHQFVKIVHDQLRETLGGKREALRFASQPPTVIMVCGLQGSGKTTTCAKLGAHLKRSGKRVILAAADIYRPAAVEQLEILAQQAGCSFFKAESNDAAEICSQAVAAGVRKLADAVILDTAGRLHIDEEMMAELVRTKAAARPHEILLVLDSMTGQDAANVAAEFNARLGLTGAILTKLDSDARGGAALSVRAVSGAPIKFVGVGEKIEALEEFHPDRMASRILGMGDIVTLVEKAQAAFDQEQARKLEERARKNRLTLEDFAEQMRQVRKMGSLSDLAAMIPGLPRQQLKEEIDERAISRMEAIINSMTPQERRHPQIFNSSRRQRVARGSGTSVQEVNQLLRQFEAAQKMMKIMAKGKGRRLPAMFGM